MKVKGKIISLWNNILFILNKKSFLIVFLMIFTLPIFSYEKIDTSEMTSVTGTIRGFYSGVSAIVKAVSCVFIYIGAFKVYWKMQHGERDVSKTIVMIIGGCVALMAMITIFPLMFSYT